MIYRSAITGHFVTAKYAKCHPKTTVKESVRKRPKGSKKLGKWLKRAGRK